MYITLEKETKVRIEVRNNNVDKAMRILKKKLTEDGFFNELREREYYESKGTKRRKAKAAAKRRSERDLKKRMENEGY
jgi:small subunit ribosomal protein S21